MSTVRNIFAVLVHESQDCIIDLVRNLHSLDPASLILLYNGGGDPKLLPDRFPLEQFGAVVHPAPRPVQWGQLHAFALDCMAWACENRAFDTLTVVDSDQLATRPGYSEYLTSHLAAQPRAGVLGNSRAVEVPGTRVGPAEAALREIELWKPLLREFPDGEAKFVHWCFWPSTVFTADAARDLVALFATNRLLQDVMAASRIWATEEVILPTLVALMGYEVCTNPCSCDFVKYRVPYSLPQLESALDRSDVFWIHPVPRYYDDPLRKRVREKFDHYRMVQGRARRAHANSGSVRLLLTTRILRRMRSIEGWLEDEEADLLIAALTRAAALANAQAVVEIGSYCGRSTVVLGGALSSVDAALAIKIYAIDPHNGIVGALDQGIKYLPPSLFAFRRNISEAGLDHLVESIVKHSFEVEWSKPICLLLIDGLHDYANVSRDFHQFERSIVPGGFVAFHDYASYYPGVMAFVDELLARGSYEKVDHALSMIVLRKRADAEAATGLGDARPHVSAPSVPAPAIVVGEPLVSCIMPTADRRAFVPQAIRYFLRQDYGNRELIVLDDGADPVDDLAAGDARIRYVRLDTRQTLGAKYNLAGRYARGDILVHWDDDDWMADWRLSYQVENQRLLPRDSLSGLARLFFYDPGAVSAWEYIYPATDRPWVAGATFCYFREFSEQRRFPDLNEGADTVFVWGLRDAMVITLSSNDFYVALIHPRNTSPKRLGGYGWHAIPAERIHGLLDKDLMFYRIVP
jgi:Methyltransferase domain/Glycosyl transferase family 2